MLKKLNSDGCVASERRDQFIPIRKSDLLKRLVEDGRIPSMEDREQFQQLCRLLGAIFHYEYFDRLEKLRDDYYYFNPEQSSATPISTRECARADLLDTLATVLKGANYVEVTPSETDRVQDEQQILRVKTETPMEDYHQVRFFGRGRHRERVDVRKWSGLRKNLIETTVYDNVVLIITIKHESEITSKRHLRRLSKSQFRPGSILIKHFRNIAASDLSMLYPKVRVVMSSFDKLTIAVPALAGGVPLLINLLPALTVLFLVAAFYLGLGGPVAHDDAIKAFAAVTGLAALVGLIMRQRLKYERLSLKYQKQIADHFYFRNVSNNAGIFDYIVGAAEEQECKEAFLAYYFLLTTTEPLDQGLLDVRIEGWLKETFGVDIDFEVDDALAKLERLGLLKRAADRLSVPLLDEALVLLDRAWDNFFLFANAPENDLSKGFDA